MRSEFRLGLGEKSNVCNHLWLPSRETTNQGCFHTQSIEFLRKLFGRIHGHGLVLKTMESCQERPGASHKKNVGFMSAKSPWASIASNRRFNKHMAMCTEH